jgi:hypothetical protein
MAPFRAEVVAQDGGLAMRFGVSFNVYDSSRSDAETPAIPLHPLGGDRFKAQDPSSVLDVVQFVPGSDGRMKFCAPMPFHLLARV